MKTLRWLLISVVFLFPFVALNLVASASPQDQIAIAEAAVWVAQNQNPAQPGDAFQGPVQQTPERAATPMEASCTLEVYANKWKMEGSGTVIGSDEDGSTILTAEHVVQSGYRGHRITVTIDNTQHDATLIRADSGLDLALVHITAKFRAVRIAESSPPSGSTVTSYGAKNVKVSKVLYHVDDDYPPLICTNATEVEGRSGGGLFYDGKLCGVTRMVENSKTKSFYVNINTVNEFIAKSKANTQPIAKMVATVYTGEEVHGFGWCHNCRKLKLNWKHGNEEVDIVYSSKLAPDDYQLYPAIRFINSQGKVLFPAHADGTYKPLTSLEELVQVMKRNDGQPPPAQTGPAGAFKASSEIKRTIAWFREYVGEGVESSMRWDRSGAQSFPLLAKGDWSAIAIFGAYGHMQLSAKGALNLPIESIGFGYNVDKEDLILDLDAITLNGWAARLSPQKATEAYGAQPSQVGLMTIWTITTIVKDVFALLNPTCDLQLGGNITATAILQGDTLTIQFQECPHIKIVALFQFNLGVKTVVVTEQSVRVIFSGSSLVKERTFAVQ